MKKLLLLLLISSTAPSVAANSFLRKVGALVTGSALAYAGHFACEYISTMCHELGHASAYKLMIGGPTSTTVFRSSSILAPWAGNCSMSEIADKKRRAFILASGPLAGIVTTFAQVYLLNALERNLRGSHSASLSPLEYFKEMYHGTKSASTAILDKGEVPGFLEDTFDIAFKMLKFFRFSRIVGESIYGFTPVAVPQGVGDGQKLWAMALNRDAHATVLTNKLSTVTGIIMLSPALAGLSQALRSKA